MPAERRSGMTATTDRVAAARRAQRPPTGRVPPVVAAERQERIARFAMIERAEMLAELALAIRDHPSLTRDRDMERLASVLVALGERYGQYRILRAELRRLRAERRCRV